ncbi:MAG: hypothetical protein KBD19_01515 [Candidatus Moranbacteria bacterium]|nr:hypothetical protein [Candidatus Moranbacteria bacterium]
MVGVDGGAGFSVGGGTAERKNDRARKIIFIIFLSMIIMGGAFFLLRWYFNVDQAGPSLAAPVVIDFPDPVVIDATPDGPLPSVAPYQSERFRAGEIAIGGEAALFVPETDVAPLEIFSVRGEAFTEKGKNGAKLVITWETNKPALSEISYGKGVGQAEGIIREEGYGTNHSLVIPDLTQSSTYVYVISSRDKWGNEAESDPYAVYTGARDISLFELIAGAIGDVFGWAVDK